MAVTMGVTDGIAPLSTTVLEKMHHLQKADRLFREILGLQCFNLQSGEDGPGFLQCQLL